MPQEVAGSSPARATNLRIHTSWRGAGYLKLAPHAWQNVNRSTPVTTFTLGIINQINGARNHRNRVSTTHPAPYFGRRKLTMF